MEQNILYALSDILEHINDWPWDCALYLRDPEPWGADTPGAILDSNEVEDEVDDDPAFAREHGLRYVLEIATVQDITANTRAQRDNPTLDDLLKAFTYYYTQDAFIDWHAQG